MKSGVKRLVNDCGTNDAVLILSQAAVLFTGMAGRTGMAGLEGSRFVNRYFNHGHGGYFYVNGKSSDAHMKEILGSSANDRTTARTIQ